MNSQPGQQEIMQHSFGEREFFSIDINGSGVDVYVAGMCLTEVDNIPYLPSFITSLSATERSLRSCLNFLKYEGLFFGLSVEEGYFALRDSNQSSYLDAFSQLRFADWGPITDGHLCFLLPITGRLYAAACAADGRSVRAAPVQPYNLVNTIRQTLAALKS